MPMPISINLVIILVDSDVEAEMVSAWQNDGMTVAMI